MADAEELPLPAVEPEAEIEVEPEAPDEDAELPEMLDLIDHAEAAAEDPAALAAVIGSIARRVRATPGDRDLLSDFEGIAQVCIALSRPPIEWRGETMAVFCAALPDICRKSTVNRAALREGGVVEAVCGLLAQAVAEGDAQKAASASAALTALCTANDGNKKAAAQIRGDFNEKKLAESCEKNDPSVPVFVPSCARGALELLMDALERFADDVVLQTEALCALRCLVHDDDPRQGSCVPSAVENRDWAIGDKHFKDFRAAAERALNLEERHPPQPRLREYAMLLLKEVACRQNRIHELVYDAGVLRRVESSLGDVDERVVRACLALIRAFGFADDIKEQLAVTSDVALRALAAVQQHVAIPAVCEQGFGLFANLTIRKPHIAKRLNGGDYRVIAVGQVVMERHRERPGVVRSVIQTIRNVATQDDAAELEVKESGFLDDLEKLIIERGEQAAWRNPVEISKQFLREFRADRGVRKGAVWNEYY